MLYIYIYIHFSPSVIRRLLCYESNTILILRVMPFLTLMEYIVCRLEATILKKMAVKTYSALKILNSSYLSSLCRLTLLHCTSDPHLTWPGLSRAKPVPDLLRAGSASWCLLFGTCKLPVMVHTSISLDGFWKNVSKHFWIQSFKRRSTELLERCLLLVCRRAQYLSFCCINCLCLFYALAAKSL